MRSLVLAAFLASAIGAQTLPPTAISQTKFNSGQDVVPSFDGWLRNSDGTFTMVFGYMNRNYEEEPLISPGPDNKVEPGPADQGQPTFFLPRRHAWIFQVKVPADWGEKELVWTITAHGRTEKAYATLRMEQEIIPRVWISRGSLSPGLDDPNQPPKISIAPVSATVAGTPVHLTALVTDDGLPKPRVPKTRPGGDPSKAQTNIVTTRRSGLSVRWYQYRGPAKVIFDSAEPTRVGAPGEPVTDGKAVTTAHFSEPGIYILRATADDGSLTSEAEVTITVSGKN
jgi:hypothetical protein